MFNLFNFVIKEVSAVNDIYVDVVFNPNAQNTNKDFLAFGFGIEVVTLKKYTQVIDVLGLNDIIIFANRLFKYILYIDKKIDICIKNGIYDENYEYFYMRKQFLVDMLDRLCVKHGLAKCMNCDNHMSLSGNKSFCSVVCQSSFNGLLIDYNGKKIRALRWENILKTR